MDQAEELKVADKVWLISGSPPMTIEEIQDGKADCVWFEKAKLCRGTFKLILLTKKDPDEDMPMGGIGVSMG